MEIPSFPFTILVFAPFHPKIEDAWKQGPVPVTLTNFDQVMEDLGLGLEVPLPKNLCPAGEVTLAIKKLKDFHPDALIANTPFLKNLGEAMKFIKEAKFKGVAEEELFRHLKSWTDLPLTIQWEPPKPQVHSTHSIDDILKMVSLPEERPAISGETQSVLAQIELLLRQAIRTILAHEDFRNLEAVWRGLRLLLSQDQEIIVKIIPVSFATLEETLDHLLLGFIQNLPSLVLLDLPLDNSPRSIGILAKMAAFAETLLVPAIGWITPRFLYLDTWQDLPKLSYLPHYLRESAFAKWRHLRESSSARWVALTCNRFLVRFPYGADNKPGQIQFEEAERLWISPVWAAGSLITQSFAKNGWPTRFTEWQRVRLENLALGATEDNNCLSTETLFPEDRIDQLNKGGLIPLIAPSNKDFAFVPFETTVAGSSLSHQLFLSRITQFLLWCKDHGEQDLEPKILERRLAEAFGSFWEKSGHRKPQDLEIAVSKPDPGKPASVRIAVKPSPQILPGGKKVELEMNW